MNIYTVIFLQAYFPWYTVRDAITKLYPIEFMLKMEGRKAVDDILSSFDIKNEVNTPKIDSISIGENFTNAVLSCNGKKATVLVSIRVKGEYFILIYCILDLEVLMKF